MSGKPRLTAAQRKAIKETIVKSVEKMPSIKHACHKVGISRMTLCRWRKKDQKFSKKIDEVLMVAHEDMGDLAEAVIFQGIQKGNVHAAKFYLSHNHPRYKKAGKENSSKPVQPIIWLGEKSPYMTGGPKKKKDE